MFEASVLAFLDNMSYHVSMEETRLKERPLDGSFWFGVELKSFEIFLESLNGKMVERIVERGRGFSSWIRFGERDLSLLLEGMEDYCEGKFREPLKRVSNRGERGYKLELCSNKAGRFLLCSAMCIEEKKFSLVFPEGKAP